MKNERFIPPGAVKVCDKRSDAVAYLYLNSACAPCARVFFGKQSKPVLAYRFRDQAERERAIVNAFQGRRARAARMAEYAAERKAVVNTYQIGAIFCASWGYDQTNINYYQVISATAKTVTVRELAQERVATGFLHGRCVPMSGQFLERSKPKVCRIGAYSSIKISSCQQAYFVKPEIVGGVPVYSPSSFSETH
jgi:hypothetical protein